MMNTRRRNLIVLGSAALVSVALAGLSLELRTAQGTPHYTPVAFLPGFGDKAKDAAQIQISSAAGNFTAIRKSDQNWVIAERGGYPADFEQVRRTLIGLASIQTIAPKTGRADWLHYLSLDAPPKGAGTQITVKDAQGKVLADLIAGHTEELGDASGTTGLFVRRPGENQAWLARTTLVPQGSIGAWLSSRIVEMGPMQLRDVAITPPSGPGFSVGHAQPSAPYSLSPAPKPGTGTPNNQIINDIAFAIYTFNFTDVRADTDMDFGHPVHVLARRFDGLNIAFDLTQLGPDFWVRVSAMAPPGSDPALMQEAAAINGRTHGWAYKLPPQKARVLLSDHSQLVLPPQPMFPGMPTGAGAAP